MPTVDNDSVTLYYETEGDGPLVFLQHGIAKTLETWRTDGYVEALRSDYRLVLMDARGHGKSDKPHDIASYAWEVRASDVLAVADHLGAVKLNFWGYSMGGMYAFSLIKFFPDRVNSLIVGGSNPAMFGDNTGSPFRDVDGSDPASFVRVFETMSGGKLPPHVKTNLLTNDFEAIAASLKANCKEQSMQHVAQSIDVPCLLYVGENDFLFDGAKDCAQAMADCRFVPIHHSNHPQTFMNSPEVLPHVSQFLQAVTGGR